MTKSAYTYDEDDYSSHFTNAHKIALSEGIIPASYYSDPNAKHSWRLLILNKEKTKGLFLRGRY